MKIAPSILACDFSQMGNELLKVANAGADIVHMDVMDGHFVPNISFGPDIIKSLRKICSIPFDVHLMISDPKKYIQAFVDAGADNITFHIESDSDPYKIIKKVRSLGKSVGISFNPTTDISNIIPFLPLVDIILVMTVEPGFGGQPFLESQIPKIIKLRSLIDQNHFNCLIEVDGGVDAEISNSLKKSGVDICVAGTSIFKSGNIKQTIDQMKNGN